MNSVNIILVGVGGQGVILASDLVAQAGMNSGMDIKKSDSFGMAQRGGSVVSHVRWGRPVYSPMVKTGDVDFLLAFEQIEAARFSPYLKPEGIAVVADVKVPPAFEAGKENKNSPWPVLEDVVRKVTSRVYLLPAAEISRNLGNPRALNMVILGFFSACLNIKVDIWTDIIRERVHSRFFNSSIKAFQSGFAAAESFLDH